MTDERPTDRTYAGKRALDLGILVLVGVPATLIGALCSLLVRVSSRGPVLFRQERVGHLGVPFELLKFRTMVDAPDNPMIPDPERITAVGRALRRFSLDELPQLLNVARGDMSIVGPRPTVASQVERYDERQRRRLAVRPGMTGLAQVSGRNALTWPERIEMDLEYVDTSSWALDLRLLLRTVGALLSAAGVEGHPDDPIVRDPSAEG